MRIRKSLWKSYSKPREGVGGHRNSCGTLLRIERSGGQSPQVFSAIQAGWGHPAVFYRKKKTEVRMEKFFEIGVITGTHGIRGTMRVFPTTQDPSRFERLKEVTVENKGKQEIFHIKKVAFHKKFVLLTVKEITDINAAELYKNARLLIPDAEAIPLEADEYYTRDLYGLRVVTDEGEELGELAHIYETGANDVYAVRKTPEDKELLIPAIKDCIRNVDLEAGVMTVHLLEGLRA